MAIAWVVEHHSDESEYCHGPFSNAFEALRACDDIEEMTTLYIANDRRTAVVEMPCIGAARPVPAWMLPECWDTLAWLEKRRSDGADTV